MWFHITFLLFVGVAVATLEYGYQHAWETGNEYQYLMSSRTMAGLDMLKRQYTGIQVKGILTIQAQSPDMLNARISNPQYARIHQTLMDGPNSEMSDQMLEYNTVTMSGKPFQIKLKHGVIRDLLIDRDVPTWEVNLIKSTMSMLQIDTQGENALERRSALIPTDENSPAMFKAMEDSVSGKCEVLYTITPLPHDMYRERPDKLPLPHLRGGGQHYDIKKVKNYEKCQQRQFYHHRLQDLLRTKRDKIISQLSTTHTIISGTLKQYTIQSAMLKSQISVRPDRTQPFLGNVHTMLKLTLVKKGKIFSPMFNPLKLTNLESTGNLLYMYNSPFSYSENRKIRQPSISENSRQVNSSESSSSSFEIDTSASSSSSSEENSPPDASLYQPRAALHMAPNIPLLPFFVGNKGKSIQMSEDTDIVKIAAELVYDIVMSTEYPSNKTSMFATLERYTILRAVIRAMNFEQLTKLVQDEVCNDTETNDKENERCKNVWSVISSTVVQSGTGPALLTISSWLKNKTLKGLEAAVITSQLPKYVLEPSAEYNREFFKMVTDPIVLEQKYLNVSAPLALAELIYSGLADRRYPIYSFGPLTNRSDDTAQYYIPYLAKQLEHGLIENNIQKIHTYIMALGMTGHSKVISVMEPYIEGTKPMSKYQRFLMIAAMSVLSQTKPKLVGPIFYKLYMNKNEDHEIRCMSIHTFIMTNPSLIMLQSIAKNTNTDSNDQVNSAVKTTIESLANTERPELQSLAEKARKVKHLLSPKKYSMWYSRGYYKGINVWYLRGFNLQTVGDYGTLPKFFRASLNTIFDSFEPTLEVAYGLTSFNQLYDKMTQMWNNRETSEESSQKSHVEKLVQALNIKPEKLDKLEGCILFQSALGLVYYPFDSHTIQETISYLRDFVKKTLDSTLFITYEMTLSLPTESGMPFVYTWQSPTVMKLKAEWNTGVTSVKRRSGTLNAYIANKVQKQFGFLAPFEHQHYMASIDDNRMLQIPIEYEVELNMTQRNRYNWLKIRPNLPLTQMDSPVKLLHLSTIMYTTRQDVLDFQPATLNSNSRLILTSGKRKTTLERDSVSIHLESDDKEMVESLTQDNIIQFLMKLYKRSGTYRKLEILMNPEQRVKSESQMYIAYEKMAVGADNDNNKQQLQELEWQTVFPVEYKKPNSEKRRKEIMTSLSKGLNSGNVHIMDIWLNTSALEDQQVYTISFVSSNTDRKTKAYAYWNSQSSKRDEPKSEVCYIHEIRHSPDTPLNRKYMIKNASKDKAKFQLQYGESCSKGTRITMDMNATRSNQLKALIENSGEITECREEIRNGDREKILWACQRANEFSRMKDNYNISISPPEIIRKIEEYVRKILDFIASFFPEAKVKLTNSDDPETNTANIKVTMSTSDMPGTYMYSQQMDVTLPNHMTTQQQLLERNMFQTEEKSVCTIDKNMILTFDKRLYSVTLGDCNHVLLTTYPQYDVDNQESRTTIPRSRRVAVLARDKPDDRKIITVLLGDHVIELREVKNDVEITVDKEPISITTYRSFKYFDKNGEIMFEVIRLPDESIEIFSERYNIKVVTDGNSTQIIVPNLYSNALRGLCGNFDSETNNDFLTPRHCIMNTPEVFAATYAMIQEDCQGPAMENRRKIEQVQCQEMSSRYQNNVINDREAGRTTQSENWGYYHKKHNERNRDTKYSYEREDTSNDDWERRNLVHRTRVVQEDQEICFTTRPVLTCSQDSRPMQRRSKKYELYCLPTNEESLAMKDRIEQGANPDLTRMPSNRSITLQIPMLCSVA